MIQEQLGFVWRRLLALKYLMVLTVAFNVFTASSGLIAGYFFWRGTFSLSSEIINHTTDANHFKKALELIEDLKKIKPGQGPISRAQAVRELQSWESLRLRLENLNLGATAPLPELPQDYFTNSVRASYFLQELKAILKQKVSQQEANILALAQRESALVKAVIWIGALTLVFGVAIPLIIFSLTLKALRQGRKALTKAAQDIVADWSKTLSRYGEDPFRNAHFWIEALLILTEQIGAQSRHPAALLSAELSHLVRHELERTKKAA